jgi:hypothetical protein
MACWSVSSSIWCILIQVAATLSVMSDSLSLQSSHSMVVVFGLEDGGSEDVGYDYVIRIIDVITLHLMFTSVNVLRVMLVLVCRCKHSTWLKKLKWLN